MKRWHVNVVVERLTGKSIREVDISARSRKKAREYGLEYVKRWCPSLFELGNMEGVPRVYAKPILG